MPSPPSARLLVPGPTGPRWLEGLAPQARWSSASLDVTVLREALAALKSCPDGLLVGVLPYPDAGSAGEQDPTSSTLLLFGATGEPVPAGTHFRLTSPFRPDWSAEGYIDAAARIKDYLAAGDAYQVNLAQRFSATCEGDTLAAFEMLFSRFQPPFAAWLDLGDRQILSLSPESFLSLEGRRVTTRPIKGTRPRDPDPARDSALAADLLAHPKDRAENLMIVDLLRNDLGRVCRPGSVRVPDIFRLESFRNVHHLVSTVTGELAEGRDLADLLQACFPGGSITGAPKRRAMEIIAELEPLPRDVYCGSVFWVRPDGTFGSNIAIRTFLVQGGRIFGWAGAGIVADSVPALEQEECLHKLAPLMRALEELK